MSIAWENLYTKEKQPTAKEIAEYIDNPLWAELNNFLQESYQIEPKYNYSGCSGQPGWNIKYQKAGRSLCTLYPMPGYFIALVVIGTKEQNEAELVLSTCTDYIQKKYADISFMAGAKWLMIDVTDKDILADVKKLIQTRRKIKANV